MAKPDKTELKTKKTSAKKADVPRIRKTETLRERNQKAIEKAETKANKPKRRVRKAASAASKPFKKPASIITKPFKTRPMRFLGRTIGRILWPKYFRDAYQELKQVTWPSRRETWKLTIAVLIFAIVFGLAAAGTDFVLDKIIRRIVFRA